MDEEKQERLQPPQLDDLGDERQPFIKEALGELHMITLNVGAPITGKLRGAR